ncbi:unnamed protein product [Darwinula stevensoni]|uniref:Uncharacterized protein n=1 Tax=Darwinula stevensoni TaxID=69355 RepID=A0A7R9ADS4_9CRUS|nr:unnamed protein product [Darwinula stevensoni]CAG0901274.1 unnamed protein product [Darwinula stevensoni]
MTDSKYFTTTKKGEIYELKSELNSEKKEKKREAVKKVIASMTVGKDVSSLFPDVVNCMQTDNLELKKLVYLYLMNYAKSQPDMAIMAVNTFVKVVANAVAALAEISETSTSDQMIFDMTLQTINKLLTALNECTEWGQIFILDALANYNPKDDKEAQSICERVTPRLAHANAAVVLSAVKVLMKFMEALPESSDFVTNLTKKLSPPLVTLLSSEPEVQYVALRNINLIVQKRPDILKHEMKVFFVKYNDPIYVKLEKLDIMIRLASQANIAQVLSELKEYATEVDVDFVRKSVRAIGRCAIKVEQSAERCVATLLDLIQTKVNYVVQEAVVVIKDIFRKYPNKYESIISTLCENLDTLDEPEARASMIWIIGEYAERINNADELLEGFLQGFADENTQVQLQLLTAVVKLFLKKPSETQELVQQVLSLATQDSDNPDLRDRGFIYWRLLSTDPAAARDVVLAEKPLISEETDRIEPTLLDELICHISSLASVYHKPPSAFIEGRAGLRKSLPSKTEGGVSGGESNALQSTVIPSQDSLIGDLLSLDINPPQSGMMLGGVSSSFAPPSSSSGTMDLLGSGLDSLLGGDPGIGSGVFGTAPVPAASTTGLLGDIFGFTAQPTSYAPPKQIWLPANKGKGLEVSGTFTRRGGIIYMELTFRNQALQPMSGFAIQLNKNSFGLIASQALQMAMPLIPHGSSDASLPLATNGPVQKMEPLANLQVAVKNNLDVFYFAVVVPMNVYFTEDGQMDRKVFLATWKDIPATAEVQSRIPAASLTPDGVSQKLQQHNIFTIAKWTVEGQDLLYQSMKFTNGIWVLAELKFQPASNEIIEQRIEMVSPSSDKEVQASPIQSVIDGLQQTSKGRLTYRRHGEHHLDLQHSHSASSHASPPTRLVLSEQTSLVASHLMPIGDQVLSDTEDEDDGDLETVKDDSDEETSLLPPDSAFHKEFLLYEEERRRRINDAICQKMLETEKELRALYESVEAQFLVQQQEILKAHQDNLRPLEHEQLIRWERVLKKQEELRASEAQQALEAESHLHREVERLDLGKRLGEASAAREILNEILKQHLSLLASKQVDESATRMRRIKVLMQDLENGSKDKDKVAAFKTELHGLQEWIGFIQNEVALALARAKQKEEDMKATNTVIPEAQTVSTAIKSPSLKKDSLVEGEIQSHTEEKQIHKEQKSSEEKEFGLKGYVSKESLKRWAMVQEKLTFAKRNSQELSTTPALKKFRFELQETVVVNQ